MTRLHEDAERAFDDAPQADGTPTDPNDGIPENAIDRVLDRFVWCQKLGLHVDLLSCEMLPAKAFNAANT